MRLTFSNIATIAAAAAAVSTLSPHVAQAQGGSRPILEVVSRTTDREGGTDWTAKGDSFFVPGQPSTWFVFSGSSHPEDMTVCGGGVSEVGGLEDKLARNSFVWKLALTPVSYENGRQTFDLEWARYRRDGAGRASAQGKSTVTLAEGQRRIVDLVHGTPGTANCKGESTLIEVGAGVREDPRLAQAMLQYDMWLTNRGARGEDQTRHFMAMGRQGADVGFAFVPLRFQIEQRIPNQVAYDVIMSVEGTVRGRLQENGRIALTVDTTRWDGLGRRGEGATSSGGSSGVKRLDVGPSEAVEIELPAASGRSSLPAIAGVTPPPRRGPAPPATEAVTIADGRVTVDDRRFFAEHRTSLVLQVKEVR